MSAFKECVKNIHRVASMVDVDKKLVDDLCKGGDVIEMDFPAMTIRGKKDFDAVTVLQINPHEDGQPHPRKGGIRCKKYKSKAKMIDMTKVLALDMAKKNILADLPFAGGKTCININSSEFTTDELWSIFGGLTVEMLEHNILDANIYVPATDYGTNSEMMKWIYRYYWKLNKIMFRPNAAAVVTGKPVDFDGIPGREDATSRGGLIVLRELLKPTSDLSFAIQGFGNVGRPLAELLNDESFEDMSGKVVAVSDINSGLYNPNGIPYRELSAYHKENKTFKGCSALGDEIAPDEITGVKSDVFVTAAQEDLINGKNAKTLKCEWLLELGNSAVTREADEILNDRNILVIPDIIANAGGVVVSYLEWRKNRGDILHEVDLKAMVEFVHDELRKVMKKSVEKVLKTQEKYKNSSLRLAADIRALTELDRMMKRKNA